MSLFVQNTALILIIDSWPNRHVEPGQQAAGQRVLTTVCLCLLTPDLAEASVLFGALGRNVKAHYKESDKGKWLVDYWGLEPSDGCKVGKEGRGP